MPTATRTEKLDLRLTPSAKRVLQSAATATQRSVSEFVLESALARAEETLPDRQRFGLDAERVRASAQMSDRPRIEKLRRDHHVDGFDCGQEALNRFLVRYAFQNQQAEASQTYVAVVVDEVVGFYTLVVAQVEYDDAPQRLGKGLAKHPIPLMLLARLAVATGWQGKGLGSGLLKDAMLRTLQAADIAGIRGMAVHAKDDNARAFYERYGFVPAPTDPYHLFVLLKDVRALLTKR